MISDYDLQQNIIHVKQKIAEAARRVGRNPDEILILGVTKTVDTETMQRSYDYGITHFGENRVQEYLRKSDIIKRNCTWHIIGRLQTNKVKYLDQRISLIHSLDRMPLAEALHARGQKIGYAFPVLVQVNISGESTKAGVEPENLKNFILNLSKMGNINVKGLMTIAPYAHDPEDVRHIFKKLKKISIDIARERVENISMEVLSMGMSGDYAIAVEEGSTIVRIGSAIYGEWVY